jgi:hypothetical protein
MVSMEVLATVYSVALVGDERPAAATVAGTLWSESPTLRVYRLRWRFSEA